MKNSFLKKALVVLLSVATIISFDPSKAFAGVDLGDFSYWHPDINAIEYWPTKSFKVLKYKYSDFGMASTTFDSCVSNALSSWNSPLGISTTYTNDQSIRDMEIFGISRSTANSSGVPSDAGGITATPNVTRFGVAHYDTMDIEVYKLGAPVHVYLVWDASTSGYNTSKFSPTQWKQVFAHEYGHAIGYDGHYNGGGTSIMYPDTESLFGTSGVGPSSSDIQHMHNVY